MLLGNLAATSALAVAGVARSHWLGGGWQGHLAIAAPVAKDQAAATTVML